MRRALHQLRGDVGRREIGDLDIVKANDGAAVFTRAAWLHQVEACTREKRFSIFLQPAFRWHCDDERSAHAAPPLPARRSIQTAKPTAGIGAEAPSRVSSPS